MGSVILGSIAHKFVGLVEKVSFHKMAQFVRLGKKIIGIGRNYAAHAKELNNAIPKEPFFFLKPTTSYLPSGGTLELPRGVVAHHEVELGVVIGKDGRDISQSHAYSHISGYALAVDVTARNLQDKVRNEGLPWSAVKGFDTFTPISRFVPKEDVLDPHDLRLLLLINGQIKQIGTTGDMIFKIPQIIEHVSSIMKLEEGDVILTGTPSGVGPVSTGDKVKCTLSKPSGEQLAALDFDALTRKSGYHYFPE